MTHYYIRQDLLSSSSRTIIKNQKGEALYLMVGRWGMRGDVLSLYQMNGDIVASIKQANFAFKLGSRFDLYHEFEKVGSLQRVLSFNRDFYFVHQLGWVVMGDIGNHEYTIYHLNRCVMRMEKASLTTGDFYALEIPDKEEAPLCICIAAVLDYWLLNRKKAEDHLKKHLPNLSFD